MSHCFDTRCGGCGDVQVCAPDPFTTTMSQMMRTMSGMSGGGFVSQSYSRSQVVGPDGRPVVKEARRTKVMDADGRHEARYEVHDEEEQEELCGMLRGTRERGVTVEKKKDLVRGVETSNTEFRNMSEQQVPEFDREWEEATAGSEFWTSARANPYLTAPAGEHAGHLSGLPVRQITAGPPGSPAGPSTQGVSTRASRR